MYAFQSSFCGALLNPISSFHFCLHCLDRMASAGTCMSVLVTSYYWGGGMYSYQRAGCPSMAVRNPVGRPGKVESLVSGNHDVQEQGNIDYTPQFFLGTTVLAGTNKTDGGKSGKRKGGSHWCLSSGEWVNLPDSQSNKITEYAVGHAPVHSHTNLSGTRCDDTHALGGRRWRRPFYRTSCKHKWSACMNTVDHAQRARTVMSRKLTLTES